MSFFSILFLAVGLAMDAAAVSAARGLATDELKARHSVLVAVFFGGFQALMPLLGWGLGKQLGPLVAAWDHWIAFVLLVGLGTKMLWEARGDDDEAESTRDRFGLREMLVLAVATSIDAFAVGVMLPMLNAPLMASIVVIGVTTAVLSVVALHAGHRFGALVGPRLDGVGGVVLIGLGVKILVDHLAVG